MTEYTIADLCDLLDRVRSGLTTDSDADMILDILRQQARDIDTLVAVIDRELGQQMTESTETAPKQRPDWAAT